MTTRRSGGCPQASERLGWVRGSGASRGHGHLTDPVPDLDGARPHRSPVHDELGASPGRRPAPAPGLGAGRAPASPRPRRPARGSASRLPRPPARVPAARGPRARRRDRPYGRVAARRPDGVAAPCAPPGAASRPVPPARRPHPPLGGSQRPARALRLARSWRSAASASRSPLRTICDLGMKLPTQAGVRCHVRDAEGRRLHPGRHQASRLMSGSRVIGGCVSSGR